MGLTASITVGVVDTSPAVSFAAVTNTGTVLDAVLNFIIPQGPQGPAGTQGDPGEPGTAATVTVGPTSTIPSGSNATVTNIGTTSAAVLNFAIPRGTPATVAINSVLSVPSTTLPSVTNSGTASDVKLNFFNPTRRRWIRCY